MPLPILAAGELAGKDDEDDDDPQTRLSEKGWHGAFIRSRLPFFVSHVQKADAQHLMGLGVCPSAFTTSCTTEECCAG